MERIKSLLNQVAIVRKKNTEILDASGSRFNMFSVCGVDHYENTHSAIIAEFLSPTGTHGLKSKFLELFIKSLENAFTVENFNCEKSRVRTEYPTEEGRIDVFIEDDQNKAIIIENKIYAGDQPEQLKRYNRFAENYKNGYQIIYLTLKGNDASKQSGEGVAYLPISYERDIINWLEKCVAISARFPIVRETIIQYINHLRQLTNQDMDTKNKEEITQILSKIENLKAAETIYQNYNATFQYLVDKYFTPKMKEFASQNGLVYEPREPGDSYILFNLTNPNWGDKCKIGFNFESIGYFYGIHNGNGIYKLSVSNRKILHENMKALGVSSRKETPVWPFLSHIPKLTIDNWINDIVLY